MIFGILGKQIYSIILNLRAFRLNISEKIIVFLPQLIQKIDW